MRRREFIAALGGAAAWPLPTYSQPTATPYRVALVFTTAPISEMAGTKHPLVRAFVEGLRSLGYVEGQNLVLERRSAEGRFERFAEIVTELVAQRVQVITTVGNELTIETKRLTATVPIVMAGSSDPVGTGIVASLARPGGNVTGLSTTPGPEFEAKRMELLKEIVPDASRIAYLSVAADWENEVAKAVRAAAWKMGITLIHAPHNRFDYGNAFALISRERPDAIFVANSIGHYANRHLIAKHTVDQGLPTIYPYREFVELDGLMSYAPRSPDNFRRAAGYVDKILKGAKPSDLPVEQPTKFELVINLKTAKALGLNIPPTLLAHADEVIE